MKWTGKHDSAALAERLRSLLKGRRTITEKNMFGGVCFLLRSNMLCGAGRNGFMFRVGKEQHAVAKARKGAVRVRMSGRRLEGFFWVDPDSADARSLKSWLALAGDYVGTLPAKKRVKR
jgi:TfoX/Sxy family transcriptional regulator of competence genes